MRMNVGKCKTDSSREENVRTDFETEDLSTGERRLCYKTIRSDQGTKKIRESL